MKRYSVFVLSITCCFMFFSNLFAVNIDKEIALKNDFSSVTLKSNSELHIKIGNTNKLTVKCKEEEIDKIKPFIKNGNLIIYSEDPARPWWDVVGVFQTDEQVVYNLTVKQLDSLHIASVAKVFVDSDITAKSFTLESLSSSNIAMKNINADTIKIKFLGEGSTKIKNMNARSSVIVSSSGSGHIKINKINTKTMEQNIVGNGTMSIKRLTCDSINTDIVGSGSISISGKANSQIVKVDGTGRYNGDQLLTADTELTAFGGTSIEVLARNNLSITLFGTGIINVNGQPVINKCSIFGKGQVILQSGI